MRILKGAAAFSLLSCLAAQVASKEMTFDIIYMNHSNIVVADGDITENTPAAFQSFLDTEPFDGFNFYIDLNSPGGNLFAGVELGEMIRREGLIAGVASYEPRTPEDSYWLPPAQPGICMSACALAFLGGEDRKLQEGSVLGFHQFSSAGTASGHVEKVGETQRSTQFVSGVLHSYIEAMGIAPTLFSKMSMTPPEEMYIPSAADLKALNIIPADSFSDFILEPYREGVVAYSIYYNNAQGRNVVSQVTAYCKSGVPFLMLSQPEHYQPLNKEWVEMASEYLSGFSLWHPPGSPKLEYAPRSLRFVTGAGTAVVELQINQGGVELLNGHTKISVGLPGAVGRSFFLEVKPTDKDRKVLKSAFSLCVDGVKSETDTEGDASSQMIAAYNQYLSDWSSDNLKAMRKMHQVYAERIDFYDTEISKVGLLSEKRKFAERWPERTYTARPNSFEVNCSQTVCVVAAMIDWRVKSQARGKTASGEAWYELGFEVRTGKIVFENGASRRN